MLGRAKNEGNSNHGGVNSAPAWVGGSQDSARMVDTKLFWAALYQSLNLIQAEDYEYRRLSICGMPAPYVSERSHNGLSKYELDLDDATLRRDGHSVGSVVRT